MSGSHLPTVVVLLAAYNGAAYIAAQIQSILDQDYAGSLHILLRDDGSSDNTLELVQAYCDGNLPANRQLILLAKDPTSAAGVSHNFAALIQAATAPYMALADQDDVWLPYKIRHQVEAIQQAEKQYGSHTPLLICTDLMVVNQDLQPHASSLWQLQKLNPLWAQHWQQLLVQNMVTGCTTLFNQAARAVILPVPTECGIFHDHWMATAVAHKGHVIPLAEQTVLYRQHGHNVEAAQHFDHAYRQRKIKRIRQIIQRSQFMAKQLGVSISTTTLLWHKLRLNVARLFL